MNEYWEVVDKNTGRIICHCGEEKDAFMMVSFDSSKRIYRKSRLLQDNVINVNFTKPKVLPGQQGLPASTFELDFEVEEILLPQGQGKPLNTK